MLQHMPRGKWHEQRRGKQVVAQIHGCSDCGQGGSALFLAFLPGCVLEGGTIQGQPHCCQRLCLPHSYLLLKSNACGEVLTLALQRL